jgi:hypothetical protein
LVEIRRLDAECKLLRRDVTALSAGDRFILDRLDTIVTNSREWHGELLRQLGELQSAVETVLGRLPEKRVRKAKR